MDYVTITSHIQHARKENRKWLDYAKALTRGEPIPDDAIPAHHESCLSCQWLYDHIDEITKLYNLKYNIGNEVDMFYFDIMEEVEILRYTLHEQYIRIFRSCVPELNNSLFSFIFEQDEEKHLFDLDLNRAYRRLVETEKRLDEKLLFIAESFSSTDCITSA